MPLKLFLVDKFLNNNILENGKIFSKDEKFLFVADVH